MINYCTHTSIYCCISKTNILAILTYTKKYSDPILEDSCSVMYCGNHVGEKLTFTDDRRAKIPTA